MRKIFLTAVVSLSVLALVLIHSCSKSIDDGTVEPITVHNPTSLAVANVIPGSVQPINIQFTTDRPIIWAKCMYEIDTPGAVVTTHTYPDTLFYKVLDTIPTKLNNKYTYTGSYMVPDSLRSLTVIRFDIKMKAALNPSSADTVYYDKQFTFTLR
jgi:hypothetical protein